MHLGRMYVRVANAETWKKNTSKAALNYGQAYITSSGQEKNAKVLRPGCTVKCNRCSERITQEQRQAIFDNFYELANHQRQLDYIAGCFKAKSPKEKYAAPGNKGCSVIREYSFKIKGNDSKKTKEVKVCKKMFVDTLVISDSWIKTALSCEAAGVTAQDMRGRHGNRGNKVSNQIKESVRAHIDLIPKIESHYTRETTKRLYVETENNIEELYRKYNIGLKIKAWIKLPLHAHTEKYTLKNSILVDLYRKMIFVSSATGGSIPQLKRKEILLVKMLFTVKTGISVKA